MTCKRSEKILVIALMALPSLFLGCATGSNAGKKPAAAGEEAQVVQETAVIDSSNLYPGDASGKDAKDSAEGAAAAGQKTAEDPFTDYRIGPEDVLMFRSFDDESLSTQVIVRYDGRISLPLVPDIKVSELTREEAVEKVREAYAQYFQDPLISLSVLEPRSKKYVVMGDVSRPAEYPYTKPLTLLESISVAGGLRVDQVSRDTVVGAQGQLSKAFIIRHAEANREVFEYDLRNFNKSGAHASDAPILPGDIIYVPGSINLVYVLGSVRSPGVFPMTEGTTLLQLLARAGSFDEITARVKRVVLIHQQDDKTSQVSLINVRDIIKTGRDLPLTPGDIVYVPRTLLANLQAFVTQVNGVVSPVLSLYQQAYQAYYTKDLLEQSLNAGNSTANTLLALQNSLANFNQAVTNALAIVPAGK